MTITFKSELQTATTAVEMGLVNDSVLSEEVLIAAEKAFLEGVTNLRACFLSYSEIECKLKNYVSEALKPYQPTQSNKEIRVVISSEAIENYEQEWFFNLEVVETTKIVSRLHHNHFFTRD